MNPIDPSKAVAVVEPMGATVSLQWAGVQAAHNAKPGPLFDQRTIDAAVREDRKMRIMVAVANGARFPELASRTQLEDEIVRLRTFVESIRDSSSNESWMHKEAEKVLTSE